MYNSRKKAVSVAMSSGTTLFEFVLRGMQKIRNTDLLVIGFGAIPRISYAEEMKGEGNFFEDICVISGNLNCTLVAACETELFGVKRKSAAVADKGTLINVTDMVNTKSDESYTSGTEYNVYKTGAGRIGILVDNDIYNFDAGLLTGAGCDYIISVVDGSYSDGLESVVKDNARNKCDILCACRNYSFLASCHGYRKEGGAGLFQFKFIPDKEEPD